MVCYHHDLQAHADKLSLASKNLIEETREIKDIAERLIETVDDQDNGYNALIKIQNNLKRKVT